MKLLPIALVYTIVGITAAVFGFYQFLTLKHPPNFIPPMDVRILAANGLWELTFFGFPLIALGITLLLLDEGESFFASILAVIGNLSLSAVIHQVLIYPLIQSTLVTAPTLFMGTAGVLAFIVFGALLLATSIFVHFKMRNLRVKYSHGASRDRSYDKRVNSIGKKVCGLSRNYLSIDFSHRKMNHPTIVNRKS